MMKLASFLVGFDGQQGNHIILQSEEQAMGAGDAGLPHLALPFALVRVQGGVARVEPQLLDGSVGLALQLRRELTVVPVVGGREDDLVHTAGGLAFERVEVTLHLFGGLVRSRHVPGLDCLDRLA